MIRRLSMATQLLLHNMSTADLLMAILTRRVHLMNVQVILARLL
jgi:hypothetical protein